MEYENKVQHLKLEDVLPNRFQPRIKFREDSINELANSIKEHGVIQPIVVRKIGDKYEIIAGERRYKASQIAGKETIPAIISDLDDNDSAEIALLENVQRENLTPIEEAISYKKILDMGYTQDELARKIGNKQSTIANKVRLLNLTDEVQEALLENKISERHARSLLRVSDENLQVMMLEKIIAGRYTVRKADEEIDKLLKGELEMSENNEIKATIPTSKIYEEEAPVVNVEPVNVVSIPTIEQVNEPEIAPVPVEVEEKVEMIMPTEVPVIKESPYDTKFLEPETFVNMPMHDVPTEQPLSETSEFKDGKYFDIENKEPEIKEDNRFENIFGANIVADTTEEKKEEDKPFVPTFDFSNLSPFDNIETVSFGEEMPAASLSAVSSLTELPELDDLNAITANIPTLEEMNNEMKNEVSLPVEPIAVEPVAVEPETLEIPSVEEPNSVAEPMLDSVIKVEQELPVEQNINEDLFMKEFKIPTFDPDAGSSVEVVNEDIQPMNLDVKPVEELTPVTESLPEIKLPIDLETVSSLKMEFVKMLQDKGFNVNVEDMDLADSYKLIFTIEK